MSDPGRDPHDDAYLRAEVLLDDEAARGLRRARVLASVAQDAAARPTPAPTRRHRWSLGGLAAVVVLTVGAGVAYRLQPIVSLPNPAPPSAAPLSGAKKAAALSAPAIPSPPAPAHTSVAAADNVHPAPVVKEKPAPPSSAPVPPQPPPVIPPVPKPIPEAAAPVQSEPPAQPPPPASPAPSAPVASATDVTSYAGGSSLAAAHRRAEPLEKAFRGEGAAARLRAAAAADRLAEVEALLNQGAPVDAPDAAGDTALIESVRAGNPATTALLRRRGADPERRNKAGVSATDLARAKNDPDLTEALDPPH